MNEWQCPPPAAGAAETIGWATWNGTCSFLLLLLVLLCYNIIIILNHWNCYYDYYCHSHYFSE